MSTSDKKRASSAARVGSWCAANKHFVIAAIILGVTAAGWGLAIEWLHWVTEKEPIPWAQAVKVDPGTFQNTTLATKFGPFERAEDGDLDFNPNGTPKKDGNPDGETVLDDTIMEPLGIGTWLDERRWEQRCSNWYVSRVYIDRRKKPGERFRLWRLGVFYYTGGRDPVPHVGENCLTAAGATIVRSGSGRRDFHVKSDKPAWNGPVAFRRTEYASGQRHYVQYYVFSMNGLPQNDRLFVRGQLTKPWVRHTYFTKIEFAPLMEMHDGEESDRAAQEFVEYAMPKILDSLPSEKDVERLKAVKREKQE